MNGDDKATRPNTPKVEISVRNFGPIAEADLDLRPLTVFVGPSNTGKTYLSILIYALHHVFEELSGFSSLDTLEIYGYSLDTSKSLADRKELSEVIDKLNRGQPFKFSDLPAALRERMQSRLKNLESYGNDLEEEFKRCFDLNTLSELIQSAGRESNEMGITLKVNNANWNLCNFDIRVSKSEITVDGGINTEMVIPKDSSQYRKIIYLPAARSGIIQNHQVIAGSYVVRLTRTGMGTLEVPTLSGVVADFMGQLILYRKDVRSDDVMNRIADALETEVLGGQIIVKPSPTGYPEFFHNPQEMDDDIRLTRSSSMVSELAPFVLFLRGVISSGDTLIIEEPEAHLHPAAQAQMAATLARLVRAGVRVIVTTHSDFMLQEIGNLIREGELGEKTGEPASWLEQEEVGAWLFQKNGKVKEIEFDRIKGIEPMEYEDVAETLYNRWADLQYQLDKKIGDEEDKA